MCAMVHKALGRWTVETSVSGGSVCVDGSGVDEVNDMGALLHHSGRFDAKSSDVQCVDSRCSAVCLH